MFVERGPVFGWVLRFLFQPERANLPQSRTHTRNAAAIRMDTTAKDHRRRSSSSGGKKDEDDVVVATDALVHDAIAAPTHAEVAESVAAMTSDALQGLHGQHGAHTAYSSLLTDRKRESDSDIHDDEENDDEHEDDDDPTRMIPLTEDDGTLVQCAGMEQSYESWEEFHRAMDEYCIATHQPMRLRTSDSAKAVNGRAAKRNSLKEPIDESIGFVKKLYLCTHGVKTKPRGKGKRPRQHYRYMGCPAMIRACISERKPGEGHGKNKYVVRVVAQVRASWRAAPRV